MKWKLTTLPSATTVRKVEGLLEEALLLESSTSSSASRAAAWRIESASSDNSSIAAIDIDRSDQMDPKKPK